MFKIAASLNFILAIAHLVALGWAEQVFEFYGIDGYMNELSQINYSLPYTLTVFVAIVFFIFGLDALSADGKIKQLPLLKLGIFGIAGIFILRALSGFLKILITDVSVYIEATSSFAALAIGLLYLIGGLKKWVLKN